MKFRSKIFLGTTLAISAGLLVTSASLFWNATKKDRFFREMAIGQMERLATALESYRVDNKFYPTTEQGLEALVSKPATPPYPKNWYSDGYIDRVSIPKDPWGNTFVYKAPDGNLPYSLRSKGRWKWVKGDDVVYPKKIEVADRR